MLGREVRRSRSLLTLYLYHLVDRIQTTVLAQLFFKLNMYVVDDERRKPIDFGSKVKVNLGTLCIKPCWHNTDYNFSPITLKLCMEVVDDERMSLTDFGPGGLTLRSRSLGFTLLHDTSTLHLQIVNDERKNPIDFESQGQRKNFGTLPVKPCGHDTGCFA